MTVRTVLLLATVFGSGILQGQTFTANITGLVTDPTGGAVPEAQAVLTDLRTGEARRTITNQLGRYTFSQILPSSYSLSLTKPGFKEYVQKGVQLTSNQSAELNIQLHVGAVSESVEVNASAALLDTQTSNQSSTLNTTMVQSLPLSNRAALALVTAAGAGGTYTASFMGTGANDDQNVARFNLFGGRQQTTAILIDGVPATAGDWGGLIAEPGADTVQELQVIRNTYEAQYGRSSAGVVNMTTKGGSDKFHGNAFEYFRNDHLNANDFWSNLAGTPKQKSTRNQYGGNLSGPLWKAKHIYGLFGYEASTYGQPGTRTATLPTLLQRQGDFSQTFNANGAQQVIFDPTSTVSDPSRPGFYKRDPFPGNKIDPSKFDRVANNYLKLIPLPNAPGVALTGANNFFGAGVSHYSNYHADWRVDWNPTEKHTVWFRMTKAESDDTYGPAFWAAPVETALPQVHPRYHISAGETFIVSPSLVANVTLGGGRWYEHWPNPSLGFDFTSLGFSSALAGQLGIATSPIVSMTNYATFGSSRELRLHRNNFNAQVNVTKNTGSHSIKMGFSLEVQQLNRFDNSSATFAFDQVPTSGPDPTTNNGLSGNGFASLLLGAGTSGSATVTPQPATSDKYYAFYVQDAWRVTRRLTFNYGVRYEIQPARTERFDQQAYFDPNVANPLGASVGMPNLKGGIKFLGSGNRTPWDTPYNNFAPRVGLAYRLTDKVVARAGYGITYLRTAPVYLGNPSNDGYSLTTPWTTSIDGGRTVANYWSNAFPQGLIPPPGSQNGLLQQVGLTVSEFTRRRPTPYMQEFSADIQYGFGKNTVGEIGYAGNQGRKLTENSAFQMNQLPDNLLPLGNALLANVPNPFYGYITTGTLSGQTVQYGQLLRPFPQYAAVGLLITPGASSSFNSLYTKITHQFSNGLMLMGSYQFSKAIDNVSEDGSGTIRDYNNLALDRSISSHDFPHSFVVNYRYELPFGKGKAFGSSLPRVVNALIGGWVASGVYTYTSGLPLTFSTTNNTNSFGGTQLPNISDRHLLEISDPNRLAWFNKSVFSQPAAFTYGNAPRYASEIRNDATKNMDFGIQKIFAIHEKVRMTLRGDAFNAFNHNQFSGPVTNFTALNFGQITSSRSTPRNIQVSLRLSF